MNGLLRVINIYKRCLNIRGLRLYRGIRGHRLYRGAIKIKFLCHNISFLSIIYNKVKWYIGPF